MKYRELISTLNEEYLERYELISERVQEIAKNDEVNDIYSEYFMEVARYLAHVGDICQKALDEKFSDMSKEELKAMVDTLYVNVWKENYNNSYVNPTYAVKKFGKEYGQLLSGLYHYIIENASFAFQGNMSRVCLYSELFVEIYVALREEDVKFETISEIFYSFMHDSQEITKEQRYNQMFNSEYDYHYNLVMNSDLDDESYLYYYGLNVTENETKIAKYLSTFTEEQIQAMADTYTEGYRIGFVVCNKDLSKKGVVDVRYPLGFERMVKAAIGNFEKMGLKAICNPTTTSPNKQYDFDFKEVDGLYTDKSYIERALEITRICFDKLKDIAPLMAGPAVIEVFGEDPFSPEIKEDAVKYSEKQKQLDVYFRSEYMKIYSNGIDMENRSFTIIAYPIPAIGDKFEEIFAETVKLNTLDYKLYQGIQQKIIDALDTADYVHILGTNGNKTDLKVKIWDLQDRATETAFENCVADVNIPVGEVFTSPVLEGTNGKLHVSQVYLNELNYENLEIDFEEGKISKYTCTNFEKEEENLKYIKENILYNHDTLPMGEFAIGTNTTAFVMARKYNIAAQMPILIAEKTGPHFAVGDTCYTYDEDNITYNPDGKKIVARDNSVSILRKEDISKAYLNCHTDITIPYDELGKITAVAKDGTKIDIIVNGRFVLPGTEELNKALDAE